MSSQRRFKRSRVRVVCCVAEVGAEVEEGRGAREEEPRARRGAPERPSRAAAARGPSEGVPGVGEGGVKMIRR